MSLSSIALLLIAHDPATAQELSEPAVCEAQQATLEGIEDQYQPEIDAIKEDGENHPGHHIAGDITFRERAFSIDLPSVTMRRQRIAVDIPEVTMRVRTASWDEPVVVMRRQKIGEKPEMTCNWRGCTVRWRPIYTDIPTTEMRRREVSTSIPQVKMTRRDMSTDIPELTMRTQRWSTRVPEFTIENPIPTEGPDDGRELEARAENLAARMNEDVSTATDALYGCFGDDLVIKRQDAALQFDVAINQLTAAIDTLTAAGADPRRAPAEDGVVDLVQQRDQLITDRATVLASIDAAVADLTSRRRRAVDTAAPVETDAG